jgi:hypothetical protein
MLHDVTAHGASSTGDFTEIPLAFRISAQFLGLAFMSVPTSSVSPKHEWAPTDGLRLCVDPCWSVCVELYGQVTAKHASVFGSRNAHAKLSRLAFAVFKTTGECNW